MNTVKRRKWLWIGLWAFVIVVFTAVAMVLSQPADLGEQEIAKIVGEFQLSTSEIKLRSSPGGPQVSETSRTRHHFSHFLSAEEQRRLADSIEALLLQKGYKPASSRLSSSHPSGTTFNRAWERHGQATVSLLFQSTSGSSMTLLYVVTTRKKGIGERIAEWFRGLTGP